MPTRSKKPKPGKATPNTGLTIITTHINADFDAMASMLAAQKMYPDALVVFPGSQERNLRNFFIQSMAYLFNLTEIKNIDLARVNKLVLVDTRKAERIGKLSDVLNNENIEVHIFDHHPIKDGDIKGVKDVHRVTGATVTLLTELLIEKKISLTAEEATIMCLGIYEDTGSFTFSSTTAEDLKAAAFLVSQGANINVIANLIAREISPEQVTHLYELIQNANHLVINGIEIVVSSVSFDDYLQDFAFLVHKMVKMEDINAIFALAMMENKVHVVGRSQTSEVDVGEIISTLGGGGHPTAAAATIKGQTLAQVEQALLSEIHRQVRGLRQARHLMSSPPIVVREDITCLKANKLLTRYNINALLILSSDENSNGPIGYITRQVIEKAIYHDLGEAQVKDYMTTDLATISPTAEITEVQDKIIENKQRILPVMENGQIVGVITRTDLLNILVQQSQLTVHTGKDPLKTNAHKRSRLVINFMQERFSDHVMELLKGIGEIADELGYGAYVVGGFVRDLFLYRKNEDIDIVIEGDGIHFARTYANRFKTRIHTHKTFGTAVIIFPGGFKIDVASARMEYYQAPAALPNVEMSSIKLDLFRRDFTINTLAIQLNVKKFGLLIDFFSAQKDIKDKAIRVLHNLSFVEDPTRVFRAIRFEQRFDFSIGKLTANLIHNAVKMDFFKRLSGRRVFSELRLILQEEDPASAIARMHDFDLLKEIDPSITMEKNLSDLLSSAKSVISWHDLQFADEPYLRWTVYFMALTRACDYETTVRICQKLELAPKHTKIVCQLRFKAQHCLNKMEQPPPRSDRELYHLLSDFRTEHILFMMAATQSRPAKKAITRYYNDLRNIRPTISGKDLIALNLTPGPDFKQILDAILNEKLNGLIRTREDELAFASKWSPKADSPKADS